MMAAPMLPWAPQPDVVRAAQRDAAFVAQLQQRVSDAATPLLGAPVRPSSQLPRARPPSLTAWRRR